MLVDNEEYLKNKYHDKMMVKLRNHVSVNRTVGTDDALMFSLGLSLKTIKELFAELDIKNVNGLYVYGELGVRNIVEPLSEYSELDRIFEIAKHNLISHQDLMACTGLSELELAVFAKTVLNHGTMAQQLIATRILGEISPLTWVEFNNSREDLTLINLFQKWEMSLVGSVFTHQQIEGLGADPQVALKQTDIRSKSTFIDVKHIEELLCKSLGVDQIEFCIEGNELKGACFSGGKK